ncbi:MAG: efflux RND transporter periplasmic adaptor subunit [Acidobacteriota bacterium]
MKRALIALVLIALAAGGGFFAYRKIGAKPAIQVQETAPVERGDLRGVLAETGIIKPQVGALVKIGSRVTGTINRMNVRIGDRVKKGDLIALIDDRDILRSIDRQKAALLSARNKLAQDELIFPQRIKEAQANFEFAKISLNREQQLLAREYTTGEAVDKARNQYRAFEAILKRLQDEYKTQVEISKANIAELEAQVRESEVKLSYTKIYAPIDGVVSDVTAQEGETIVTGLQVANLVTVFDPTSLEMWIYVDETDVGKVSIGQPVEFYVDTFPDRTFKGTIERINPQPVTKDNIVYYVAIMTLAKEDATLLKTEMTTHANIIFEEKKNVLTVPNAAVKFEEGKQVTYKVLGEGKVEKQEVRIGTRGENRTEVISGLTEGDVVATRLILPVGGNPGKP